MLEIILLIFVMLLLTGIVGRISHQPTKTPKQDYTPSMILVNTVGAIMMREYHRVEMTRNPDYTPHTRPTYAFLFQYDNINCLVKCWSSKDPDTVFDYTLTVDHKKVILSMKEQAALAAHLDSAYKLKKDFEDAEKEKQRQLAACDAIEMLMKPETLKVPTGGSGVTPPSKAYLVNSTSISTSKR